MNAYKPGTSFLLLTILLLALSSCKKDKAERPQLSANSQWILDSMKVYYYWNQGLPREPGSNERATAFFKSLLNPADRFSYIDSPDETKTEYSSFAWYGFEYALIQSDAFPGRLMGAVTLVVPGGPADNMGLKRGDLFASVNGTAISNSSSGAVQKTLSQGDGIKLELAQWDNQRLKPGPTLRISYARFTEKSVYNTKVFSGAGAKVGYLFYNWFNGADDYDMLDSLSKLKNAGVTDLVLDLRYNPGGDVSTAAKIAATLTPSSPDQLFAIYQANNNGGRINKSFENLIRENSYEPQNFSELQSRRMNLHRIFILTSGSTASAAELLINNLQPFIQVIQIGQPTTGKDMASFAIGDRGMPKSVNLTLHPLVFKLYNAKGEGDYAMGLSPDYIVDEYAALPLKPFGDPADPLLNKALAIAGIHKPAASSLKRLQDVQSVFHAEQVQQQRRSLPMDVHHNGWRTKK